MNLPEPKEEFPVYVNRCHGDIEAIKSLSQEDKGPDYQENFRPRFITILDPWAYVQLSKAERKGKTPEEIQALRKAKWEQAQEKKE